MTDHLHLHATGDPGRRTACWMKLCCHPEIAILHHLSLRQHPAYMLLFSSQHTSFSLDTAQSIQEQSDTFISHPAHPVSLHDPVRPWQAALSAIIIPICNLSCSCLFILCKSVAEPSYQFIVSTGSRERDFKIA